jgi:hypothetical protein
MLSTLPNVNLDGPSHQRLGTPPAARADVLPELLPPGLVPEMPPLNPTDGLPEMTAEPPTAGPGFAQQVLADVAPEFVNWLCPDLVPRGRLTVFVGESGVGKSYLAADLAARLSKFTCRLPRRDESVGGRGRSEAQPPAECLAGPTPRSAGGCADAATPALRFRHIFCHEFAGHAFCAD